MAKLKFLIKSNKPSHFTTKWRSCLLFSICALSVTLLAVFIPRVRVLALMSLLSFAPEDTRIWATSRLVELDYQAIDGLMLAFSDENEEVYKIAAERIREIGPKAIPYLKPLLKSKNRNLKKRAIKYIGYIYYFDMSTSETILSIYNDKKEELEIMELAAYALVWSRPTPEHAIPSFLRDLNCGHKAEREIALWSLETIGSPAAIATLNLLSLGEIKSIETNQDDVEKKYEELGKWLEIVMSELDYIVQENKEFDPDYYYQIGRIFKQIGRYDAAINSFRKAIKHKHSRAYQSYNQIGTIEHEHNKNYDVADRMYESGIALNSRSVYLYYNRTCNSVARGNFEDAEHYLERAIALEPFYTQGKALNEELFKGEFLERRRVKEILKLK